LVCFFLVMFSFLGLSWVPPVKGLVVLGSNYPILFITSLGCWLGFKYALPSNNYPWNYYFNCGKAGIILLPLVILFNLRGFFFKGRRRFVVRHCFRLLVQVVEVVVSVLVLFSLPLSEFPFLDFLSLRFLLSSSTAFSYLSCRILFYSYFKRISNSFYPLNHTCSGGLKIANSCLAETEFSAPSFFACGAAPLPNMKFTMLLSSSLVNI
jgi:hypothetical protein